MFSLDEKQKVKLEAWVKERDAEAAAKQRQNPNIVPYMLDEYTPYEGAIGGGLTYMFTPTGIGVFVKVKHALTGKELDLNDYSDF